MICSYVTVYQISLNIMNTNNKDAIKSLCKHNNFGRLLLLLETLIFSSRAKQFLQTTKHQLYKSYKLS